MHTNFSLKNFRVFGPEGAEMELRPVTILTGCNNSGKSSVTKALCLLKDFCRQIEADYAEGRPLRLERYKMDFRKAPNSILGSFDNVLHHGPQKEKEDAESQGSTNRIVFELVVESSWFLQVVILHLEFGSVDGDDLNNGYLRSFSVKTLDEKTIYHTAIGGKSFMDLSTVKQSLLYFLYGQHVAATAQSFLDMAEFFGFVAKNDAPEIKNFEDILDLIYKNLGATAFILLTEWQLSHGENMWKDGAFKPAGSIIKNVPAPSFVLNSPKLGVFCYFPCLKEFSEVEKKNVRQKINDAIASNKLDNKISAFGRKMIDLFVDSFEASDATTLHEYISQEENKKFFVKDKTVVVSLESKVTFDDEEIPHVYEEEDELPNKADWEVIIRAMDLINQVVIQNKTMYIDFDEINGCFIYRLQHRIRKYVRSAIEDIFANIIPGEFIYSPTTIVQPRRLYSLEDTSDFSNTLNSYYDLKKIHNDIKNVPSLNCLREKKVYKENTFVNKWLRQLDISQHVEIKPIAENSGAVIRLYGKNDRKGMLLVDKGLGISQLFAVLLKIENAIIESKINEKKHELYIHGFSSSCVKHARTYSQTHPITVALEEPEVHLHPRYQSLLADMIVEAYQEYGVHFIVETHSEYLIRKLQVLVAGKENKLTSNDVSLNYVEKDENDVSHNRQIEILEDGRLSESFGKGFYDEADELALELFRCKPILS